MMQLLKIQDGVSVILWGAIWGGLLGMMMSGWGGFGIIPGAICGALAGLTLRMVVRSEIERAQLKSRVVVVQPQTAASRPVAEPMPPTPQPQTTAPATGVWDQADAVPAAPAIATTPAIAAAMPAMASTASASVGTAPMPRTAASTPPARPAQPIEPNIADKAVSAAIAWLTGGNTVVRIGVVVLFIGLSFLAKYAVDNALLPVELRLALVGAAGIALLVTGFRLKNKREAYALTLQGAGVAVLYLTVFASFRLYQLVPPGLALTVMVAVCALSTAIALLQNSRALAVIGFAGGFLAPILTSTGQGNHVVLFSYYTLLNLAILFIAFKRSWRLLNLLGFFMTFGIATAWGALRYAPENYASTQPFLILFFGIYVLTAVLYALRQSTELKATMNGAVDGTLVFGTPLVAFGLQAGLVRHMEFAMAFSSLALGAFYLLLALVLLKRNQTTLRLLTECFLALGLGFATLAVPLALDARWTAAVWAVEGAGVFWVGKRQARWMPRAFGMLLQGIAAMAFISSLERGMVAALPFANPVFIGAMLLALPAFAIAWWTRKPLAHSGSVFAKSYAEFEAVIEKPAFLIGFFWWVLAFWFEITRVLPGSIGSHEHAVAQSWHVNLCMLAFVLSAFAAERIAARKDWAVAAWPAYVTAPALLLAAVINIADGNRLLASYGSLLWLLAAAAHFIVLRRVDSRAPQNWFAWMHALSAWTLVILLADTLVFAVDRGDLWRTAWAAVVLLVAGTAVLLCLAILPASERFKAAWPFSRFARSYAWLAAAPLALGVFFGGLLVAVSSRGNADPLPYIPLLNPTDLAVALALGAIALWLLRLRSSEVSVPGEVLGNAPKAALALAAFIGINTVWLRVAHHFAGVPWDVSALFNSFLVQTGYAILWTLLALVLMVLAHRRVLRLLWMVGAGLLGLTLAKLFLIDLSNAGGTERIIAFIVVGVLMLVVGYLAPLPPAKTAQASVEPEAAA